MHIHVENVLELSKMLIMDDVMRHEFFRRGSLTPNHNMQA